MTDRKSAAGERSPVRRCAPRIAAALRTTRAALRLRGRDKALVVEAATALLAARVRTGMLPFRQLALKIEGLVPPGTPACHAPLLPDQEALARDVRWAIRAIAPRMPFRAVCLQQAIAGRAMLARRGIPSVLHLGVSQPIVDKMEAHAWLDAGEVKVTGYPLDVRMAEVARFI